MANAINISRCLHRISIKSAPTLTNVLTRGMAGGGSRKFFPLSSTYTDRRFIKRAMFYAALTGVPASIVITYINVFYGPAQLAEIPEGYIPKHWEYYQHPITRFIAKYIKPSPQQEYEKCAHVMEYEFGKAMARKQEKEIKRQMRQRGDSDYLYVPVKNSLQSLRTVED
ncbi:NADH dehydrogenase [ubiquinone] 1 beta subcomplex subunit 5, mitochondrial-like [Anneissia japonica]|uniref:NADH dehydrogenase [ubiquinone] 1 beta subcomplex subunit 5, mitochondrial-like n=1 Tax=Anneissia japonica TaxID=1529436 RepID=UPI0014254EB8|nr:NADH dehydrogenase [ubiquinone] 1 beta subcomplex subunit 5, mitochondrial-like [Anneissia japonica]